MKKNVKNNSSGFTLIEILAVVTIVSLIFILVIPKISTSIKNKKEDVDKTTTNLVISATKLYVSSPSSKFEKTDGNVSCLPLRELVKKGYLDGPIKNVTDDKDITNSKSVRITYDNGFKYELVDSSKCMIAYTPPCDADYCDDEGNKYTEVEYLESTGTQWIDSGVQSSSDVKFDIDFVATDYNDNPLIGGRADNYTNNILFNVFDNGGTNKTCVRFSSSSLITIGNLYINQQYNVNYSKDGIYIDGQKVHNGFADVFKDNDYGMSVFGIRNTTTGNMIRYGKLKLYKLKIYDGGSLVRDYIPVVDLDDKPCMFDKLEKKCYYNKGSGEFLIPVLGNKEINYIESTGTQWIDSGVQSSSNVKFDIDFVATDYNDNPLIGGRADNYTNNILFNVYDNGGTNKTCVRFSSSSLITIGNLYINQQYNVNYSKDGIYIDGQKVHNGFSDVFKDNGYGMSVFGIRNTTTGNMLRYGKLKLYKLKIYDSDSLVRDYIPVLDKNEVPCLYDKVEKRNYYNQGTGEFLYG